MSVSSVGGNSAVQFDSLAKLIGTGDMESVLLAFGVERAQNMESAVKAKIADMRARNADIQELQQAMQTIRAAKPEKDENGQAMTNSPELQKAIATLEKNGIDTSAFFYNQEAAVAEMQALFAGVPNKNGELITNDPAKIAAYQDFIKNNRDFVDATHGGINAYNAAGQSVDMYEAHNQTITSLKVEHWNGQSLSTLQNWLNDKAKDPAVKLVGDGKIADLIKNLESKIDELTSNDQLDMISLQSMVSKQNNAIEMTSNLTSKFANLNDKIVGNMR